MAPMSPFTSAINYEWKKLTLWQTTMLLTSARTPTVHDCAAQRRVGLPYHLENSRMRCSYFHAEPTGNAVEGAGATTTLFFFDPSPTNVPIFNYYDVERFYSCFVGSWQRPDRVGGASSCFTSSIPFSALGANDSYAGVVRREDIPSGVEIRGIDDVAAGAPGSSSNPAAVLKRSDCNGSSFCHALSKDMCGNAISRYDDNTAYCGYTSRVSWLNCGQSCYGCTAIYTCSNYNGYCMYGWWIKQQLWNVYNVVGCGKCGSYTIPNGNVIGCRATLNYCSNCNDVG
ncbi:hypothetical protein V8F06_007445 [Rhypophila decipiens]